MPDKDYQGLENIQGLASLYSGVLQNMTMIQVADNAIESKANIVIAGSLVVTGLLIQTTGSWHALTILSLLLLGTALCMALACIRVLTYQSATVVISDHPEYFEKSSEDIIRQLVSDTDGAADDSASKLNHKANIYNYALWAFVTGTIIGILSLKLKLMPI